MNIFLNHCLPLPRIDGHVWHTIPTVLLTFIFSPTRSKSPVRISNAVWSHLELVEATIPLSTYKNAAFTFSRVFPPSVRRCLLSLALIVLPSDCAASSSLLYHPVISSNNDSQWRITAYTTVLNMVGDIGSPCVIPISPWNGSP